jgi:hypothetical protein
MAVITQGRRQWIVSTQTLLTWKRFERERQPVAVEIIAQDDGGRLIVRVGGSPRRWRILGKRVEELD